MKKTIVPILVFFIAVSLPNNVYTQCKSFANTICKVELKPYLHDGNYNAAVLMEGEDAELYKTFYADQQYRIAVCGSPSLERVQFQVLDLKRNVIFDNKDKDYASTWDFGLESSQQLIIYVKVEESENTDDDLNLASGCVSIMFGILDE